jgi:hypothetical protein
VNATDFPQGRPFWPLDEAQVGVSMSAFNDSTSVHNVIKNRLVAAGRASSYLETNAAIVNRMTDADGLRWLAKDSADYMDISRRSLDMHPFDGGVRFEEGATGGGVVLDGEIQASAVVLLTLHQRT